MITFFLGWFTGAVIMLAANWLLGLYDTTEPPPEAEPLNTTKEIEP